MNYLKSLYYHLIQVFYKILSPVYCRSQSVVSPPLTFQYRDGEPSDGKSRANFRSPDRPQPLVALLQVRMYVLVCR